MRKYIILLVLTAVASFGFAQERNGNRMIVHQKSGKNVVYAVDAIDSISFKHVENYSVPMEVKEKFAQSVSIKFNKPDECPKFYVYYGKASANIGGENLRDSIIKNHQLERTTEGVFTITGLVYGTEYDFYTLAIDEYGITCGIEHASATTAPSAGDDFVISITDITGDNANISITPKDLTMPFYYCAVTASAYDKGIENYGSTPAADQAWWAWIAGMYNMTWQEVMKEQRRTAVQQFTLKDEIMSPIWDTEYKVYCYGINDDGELLTDLYLKDFRTPAPVPSDNQFTIKIEKIYSDGADVKITTTNNDPFFIDAQRKKYFDAYYNGDDDAFMRKLVSDMQGIDGLIYNGSQTVRVNCQQSGTEYVLLVCGYNGGPTTQLHKINFTTEK